MRKKVSYVVEDLKEGKRYPFKKPADFCDWIGVSRERAYLAAGTGDTVNKRYRIHRVEEPEDDDFEREWNEARFRILNS